MRRERGTGKYLSRVVGAEKYAQARSNGTIDSPRLTFSAGREPRVYAQGYEETAETEKDSAAFANKRTSRISRAVSAPSGPAETRGTCERTAWRAHVRDQPLKFMKERLTRRGGVVSHGRRICDRELFHSLA